MMLTKREPDGSWSVEGIDDITKVGPVVYGALCKLKDYEKTGLNPGDFRSDSYEVKYMYKVFYENKKGKRMCILCENEEESREMQLNLEALGYKDVVRNIFFWQVLVEESK